VCVKFCHEKYRVGNSGKSLENGATRIFMKNRSVKSMIFKKFKNQLYPAVINVVKTILIS